MYKYENGTMKLVEILLRIGGRGMKQNRGGEFE
jgi:hypothetical protein